MAELKEIAALWDKINEIEKKLSQFTEIKHTENADRITIGEEALCDVDGACDARVSDVEEALCEISEIIEEVSTNG